MSGEKIYITEDQLVYKIIKTEGTGAQPKVGQTVKVHYVGTLESNGEEFDSSRKRGTPFEFTIGKGVIEGWSLGVATMKVGERSEFHIAAKYGYGDAGSPGKIPGGATLVFDIELLSIPVVYNTNEEALEAANGFCAAGGDLFRAGKFQEAVAEYEKALDAVSKKYGDDVQQMKVRANRNISVSYSKCGEWRKSLEYAEKVLKSEEKDLKALMRKLEAEINLGNPDDARKTYEKGLAASKNDPAFRRMLPKIEALEKQERARQNALFKKMVHKE